MTPGARPRGAPPRKAGLHRRPLRRPRGAARPARAGTGPRRRPRAASSRRKWVLAALLLLALALYLWPRANAPAPQARPDAPAPRAAGPGAAAKDAAPPRDPGSPKDSTAPPARLKRPAAAPRAPRPEGVSREALLAAVQARAPALRSCPLPPGAPARVSARLRIARAGDLRTVQFVNAEPLPRPLAECLRATMQRWTFNDLALQGEVQVLVDFLLGA